MKKLIGNRMGTHISGLEQAIKYPGGQNHLLTGYGSVECRWCQEKQAEEDPSGLT